MIIGFYVSCQQVHGSVCMLNIILMSQALWDVQWQPDTVLSAGPCDAVTQQSRSTWVALHGPYDDPRDEYEGHYMVRCRNWRSGVNYAAYNKKEFCGKEKTLGSCLHARIPAGPAVLLACASNTPAVLRSYVSSWFHVLSSLRRSSFTNTDCRIHDGPLSGLFNTN